VAYACALIDAPDWLMALYHQGRCQGLTELYHLRRLQGVAPQRVLAWTEQRASITRAEIQALKLEIENAATGEGGPCGSIEPAIDTVTAIEPSSAASLPAEPAPDLGPIAPTLPVDRAPSQRMQDRAARPNATVSSSTRVALFARLREHLVEIVVDVAPDGPGQVYVRRCDDDARLTVAASELALTGFERVAQAQ
jgi:ParB family chromosome partitioning protein